MATLLVSTELTVMLYVLLNFETFLKWHKSVNGLPVAVRYNFVNQTYELHRK